MGLSSRLLRLPRPQKFLGAMSLSTGATLITLSLLMNKLSGLYGILALFTGYDLSSLQLSMYMYSIIALALTVYLAPHIKSQTPLHCLALAWFYVLDSVINAAYTGVFAMTWFLVLVQHNAGHAQGEKKGPGAGTMDETSGFTNPEVNASRVDVVASPHPGDSEQDAVSAVPADVPAGVASQGGGSVAGAVLSTESMNSIGIIVALWTVRLYFCVIMLGWARVVIRQHIASQGAKNTSYTAASKDETMSENPFDESKPEGQGYGGKIGRFLIAIGRSYWLGKDEDDSWMYGMTKFRKNTAESGLMLNNIEPGPTERERRRRSGTGPPLPPAEVVGDGKNLQVPASN